MDVQLGRDVSGAVSRAGGRRFAAIALALAVSSPVAAEDDLHAFRSEDGRFSIDFPGEAPRERELEGEKFTFTDNNIRYELDVENAEFAVEIHDVPRAASALLPSRFIIENAKSGLLEDIGGREVDSAVVSRLEQPGRLVTFEIPEEEVTGKLLLVLAKSRLYLVTVRHPEDDDPPMSFSSFFESFEFWFE